MREFPAFTGCWPVYRSRAAFPSAAALGPLDRLEPWYSTSLVPSAAMGCPQDAPGKVADTSAGEEWADVTSFARRSCVSVQFSKQRIRAGDRASRADLAHFRCCRQGVPSALARLAGRAQGPRPGDTAWRSDSYAKSRRSHLEGSARRGPDRRGATRGGAGHLSAGQHRTSPSHEGARRPADRDRCQGNCALQPVYPLGPAHRRAIFGPQTAVGPGERAPRCARV